MFTAKDSTGFVASKALPLTWKTLDLATALPLMVPVMGLGSFRRTSLKRIDPAAPARTLIFVIVPAFGDVRLLFTNPVSELKSTRVQGFWMSLLSSLHSC